MNDLSLGRLRIANPDDSSPDTALQPQTSLNSIPTVSPLSDFEVRPQDYLGAVSRSGSKPISPLDDDENLVKTQTEASTSSSYSQKRSEKSSSKLFPQTYQDQQQAQFPKYPTMMPQNLHEHRSNSGRPSSMYYSQLPVNNSGNGLTRQGSYRMRTEGTETTAPQRSSSKRADILAQQGVPSRDDIHSDRSYRQPSYGTSATAIPPRRASRNVPTGRMGTSATNNTPPSSTPMSSNPAISSSSYSHEGGPLSSSEEWQERGAAVGIQRDYDANGKPILKSIKKGVKDFNFGTTLGEGSYSTVLAAQDRQTGKDYAIKVLDKRHIIKEKKVKYVNIEKETLNRLTDHPGVVRLYYTFQDERSLYFVLDLCTGGELLGVLKRMTTFDEECTRFYGAQILDTIAYMHSKGVIHRDLKPENVLLDDKRHVKITDFGTAKMLKELGYKEANARVTYESDSSPMDDRASSFVGTAEYVSPELLTDKNACKASDLWAFGCIIYQLLAGRPPFKAANEYLTFQKIVALEYEFPRGFPDLARDLVERLLVLDPALRLSLEHIRNHPFFEGVKWGRGLWQLNAPRLKAYVPPPNPPIKLNGLGAQESYPQDMTPSHSTQPTIMPPTTGQIAGQMMAKPRVITELPPPSQLDIDWSPVLTKSNERILKLGNLNVTIAQGPYSPGNESGGKFSRLFSGNTTKKRQRLVMVTSSARVIVVPAGGEEKKSKAEVNLAAPGAEVTSSTDSKGTTHWMINTRDKHFTFEDVKSSSSPEPHASAVSAQEWLDVIDQAKEYYNAQNAANNNFSTDEISSSAFSSHSTLDQQAELNGSSPMHNQGHSSRGMLHKANNTGDGDSLKGRKRFSKRQSRSGLTAVF